MTAADARPTPLADAMTDLDPAPAVPRPDRPSSLATPSDARLEDRVRHLEAQVAALMRQVHEARTRVAQLTETSNKPPEPEEEEPSFWFTEGYSWGRYDTGNWPEELEDVHAADFCRGVLTGQAHKNKEDKT